VLLYSYTSIFELLGVQAFEISLGICFLIFLLIFVSLTIRVLSMQTHFVRKWDSIDKRLSEVLWRSRNGDPEALRQRTSMLEERLDETIELLKTAASAIDHQVETLRTELTSSISKIDRTDSKSVSQSRVVVYQLERLRKQLQLIEEAVLKPMGHVGTAGGGVSKGLPPIAKGDGGYRMEAVLEPFGKTQVESSSNLDQMLEELSWGKKT